MEINHKWVSAKKYAEETGLSPEKAVQMVHNGTLEGTQTEKRLLENQSVWQRRSKPRNFWKRTCESDWIRNNC